MFGFSSSSVCRRRKTSRVNSRRCLGLPGFNCISPPWHVCKSIVCSTPRDSCRLFKSTAQGGTEHPSAVSKKWLSATSSSKFCTANLQASLMIQQVEEKHPSKSSLSLASLLSFNQSLFLIFFKLSTFALPQTSPLACANMCRFPPQNSPGGRSRHRNAGS